MFRPNYNQQRSERQRAARTRAAEKQQKLEQRTAERKAAREAASGVEPDPSAGDAPAIEPPVAKADSTERT